MTLTSEKYDIIVRYENLKEYIRDSLKEMKMKPRFFDSFKTPAPLESFLRKFSQREREEEAKRSGPGHRKKKSADDAGVAAEHTDLLPPPSETADATSADGQEHEGTPSVPSEN